MIKCKILGFYRVALPSVEVALKLRAVGAITPFFSLTGEFNLAEAARLQFSYTPTGV